MHQKGFAHIILLLGIVIIGGVLIYFSSSLKSDTATSPSPMRTYSPERREQDAELSERNSIEIVENEEKRNQKIPITKAANKPGWVTYVNSNRGYEIDVPEGSILTDDDVNAPAYYTRIKNYSSEEDYPGKDYFELKPGHYYLEIIAAESSSNSTRDCSDTRGLDQPIKVSIQDATGYKGYSKEHGGESAPIIYELCIQNNSMTYSVYASEYVLTVTPDIVNSFRLIH